MGGWKGKLLKSCPKPATIQLCHALKQDIKAMLVRLSVNLKKLPSKMQIEI